MTVDLEAYAQIMAELAASAPMGGDPDAAAKREAILAKHGLDEASWNDIDGAWQERLSAALDEDDEDGVSPLFATYVAAYEAAQHTHGALISVEQLARVTRLLQASGDLRAALAKVGVTMAEYVRGTAHWARRFASEPDVARRFEEALRRR